MKDAKKLYRVTEDQRIGGVCTGVAEYLAIDTSIVRIIFLFSALMGGIGGILYLIMWLIVPVKNEVKSIEDHKK